MIRAERKVTRDRNKEPDVTQKMKSWLIQASQALLLEPSWGSLPPARGGGQAEPPQGNCPGASRHCLLPSHHGHVALLSEKCGVKIL